jgi:hypothetical protein
LSEANLIMKPSCSMVSQLTLICNINIREKTHLVLSSVMKVCVPQLPDLCYVPLNELRTDYSEMTVGRFGHTRCCRQTRFQGKSRHKWKDNIKTSYSTGSRQYSGAGLCAYGKWPYNPTQHGRTDWTTNNFWRALYHEFAYLVSAMNRCRKTILFHYHWNTSASPHPQRRRPGVTQMMVNDHLKTHQEDTSENKLRQDQSNRNIPRSIKLHTYFILLYSNDVAWSKEASRVSYVALQNAGGNTSWRLHSLFVNTILIEAIQMPTFRKLFLWIMWSSSILWSAKCMHLTLRVASQQTFTEV